MDGVLDKVAERVADRPRPADQLADRFLSAESGEALFVVGGEGVVVPADGAAHLDMVGIDAAGGVVGRRDAPGDPVLQAALLAQRSEERRVGKECSGRRWTDK